MDPLTVLALAQTAFAGLKAGIAAGKEIQHVAKDLSDLWGSLAKLTQIAAEPPRKSLFSNKSPEQIAIERYKRQVYIEKCFEAVNRHAKDKFVVQIVQQLQKLWENRTRHGANRQKYGKFQERLLDKLVSSIVPKHERPDKSAPLNLDAKFATYCKAIVWNGQKSMGKKITREKAIRSGMVSLSEYVYLKSGQG